jgi:hypothetical protein
METAGVMQERYLAFGRARGIDGSQRLSISEYVVPQTPHRSGRRAS